MKPFLIGIVVLLFFGSAEAQMPFGEHETLLTQAKVRRAGLPIISFEDNNQLLMRALFPEYYNTEQQISRDIRWVRRNDSAFIDLWETWGDSILGLIEDYSGIQWREPHVKIHMMKYLSRDGLYNPLAIPLQGIKYNHYDEVVPSGWHQLLNVIKLFSGRNLMQVDLPGKTRLHIADHPLMQETAYRFDILTLTLATAVAKQLILTDSLDIIYRSALWRRHNPGWDLYRSNFKSTWIISPEMTLVQYLTDEPYSSALVKLTRPPQIVTNNNMIADTFEPAKLAAGGGRLGFSVFKNQKKYLEVTDIDSTGLAAICGLRVGDQIRRVNSEYTRNSRELMGRILDNIDGNGVYLKVIRDEKETGILLIPPAEEYNPIEDY